MKNEGLSAHRFRDNPEERRFAEAWNRMNSKTVGHGTLDYLLAHDNNRPSEPTDEQRVVAATVVQWLGSPVGQGFLRDLGYGLVPSAD